MAESVQPCKCNSTDCPVVLVLHDKSRHLACKHMLTNVSEYFETMFQTDMKEKQTNEVEMQEDISQSDLVVFLDAIQNPFKPLPSDAAALRSLIFLADRFMCPAMGKEILPYLINGVLFKSPTQVKVGLLATADKHRGNSTGILEAVVRLCGDLSLDQVSSLHGKITDGTLAALLVLLAKVKSQCMPFQERPSHICDYGQSFLYGDISYRGTWICTKCHRQSGI